MAWYLVRGHVPTGHGPWVPRHRGTVPNRHWPPRNAWRTLARVPRKPRPLVPGGVYHVTSRGNRRQPIVLDDDDRGCLMRLLADVGARYEWRCHAYCLMDNHYHLVVETPAPNISHGMHELNLKHAKRFNRHLLELSRYVVLNPARAGICADAASWRWSSYRATAGIDRAPRFLTTSRLLSYFGKDNEKARRAYCAFVRDGLVIRPSRRVYLTHAGAGEDGS